MDGPTPVLIDLHKCDSTQRNAYAINLAVELSADNKANGEMNTAQDPTVKINNQV